MARPTPGPRRGDDRRIALVSVVVAAAFLALAALASVAQSFGSVPAAPWLPLHLALAGGATTAIAGVMPFFVAALSGGHPAPRWVRASAVALVAAGALLVSARAVWPTAVWVAGIGGLVFLAGVAATAAATRSTGRSGLLVRRPIVTLGYRVALANLAIGASLGTLAAIGFVPVIERWALLRPAHAWANLVGFVSVVVIATLLHFLPTVLGTRIVPRRTAVIAVLGPALGVPIVVGGLVLGAPAVAGGGAVVVCVAAVALAIEAVASVLARGRWTTDPGWHLVAEAGLVAGVAWYVVGIALASAQLVAYAIGLTPIGWSTPLVAAALVVGWVVQVLIASWTHLVPAIGPGDQAAHAGQRATLGRWAAPRLVALNIGTALLAVGWPLGFGTVAGIGTVLVAAAVLSSVALAGRAVRDAR
ncbi:MAG TPA: hypothetical protein VFL03_13315 [Candidatus Limnocylindrales bacterium]|nr:hypothetical protein [Candidatus Limnocylindrales bacterium]